MHIKSILERFKAIFKEEPSNYRFSATIFLQLLGLIYFIAFLSLWSQILGLVGENGILPADQFLGNIADRFDWRGFWFYPTLFWFYINDSILLFFCALGAGLSLFLLLGFKNPLLLFFLWLIYLSFVTVGGDFLSFQWDILLLEVGFLAIFLAPFKKIHKKVSLRFFSPDLWILWLYRWLLFRLTFSSGVVKLISQDVSWRDFTALNYHYETQPLANIISWYAHQLPELFQKTSVLIMFVIELIIPFFIFSKRRLRIIAAFIFITFQILIILSGNYCFFNLLTILLCFWLIDDQVWSKIFKKTIASLKEFKEKTFFHWPKKILVSVSIFILLLSSLHFLRTLRFQPSILKPLHYLVWITHPLHISSSYGLFAVMTKERPEIIMEGSHDGKKWFVYEFQYKPGVLNEAPKWVAPHQPRLDWQMWFAALGHYRQNPWFISFCLKLMQGSKDVEGLLKNVPFKKPPKYLRALLYDYQFTNFKEKKKQGNWWKRELKGYYHPPMSLRKENKQGAS